MSYRIAQKKHLLLPLVASFVMLSVLTLTNKVHAAYDGARIIDNAVFLDSTTMSRTDIQNFLASKGSGLASRSFTLNCYGADSKERQWYTAVGAPCDQSTPASHIIYYTSQIYGVNPRVVIATLQKEQSLITSPNPTSWQLNQAMGYACPTSGQCNGSSNFFYQIDSGVWALRYHYERARGNMSWWSPSSSWVCGSEKNYYKPNLYPNQTVRFYDQNNVNYRNYAIANAATSAMYCYTPHAYNNPQGLYGRPPFGTKGMYYSGSYNFVYYFENWFGSTHTGAYKAQYYRQGIYPSMFPGDISYSFIDYTNIGLNNWYDVSSVPAGQKPITLATTNSINRASVFGSVWGSGKNRPAVRFAKVFEANGTTLASNQSLVKPGQIARFNITFKASPSQKIGQYTEWFQPIVEGSSDWNIGGLAWLRATVQ